MHAYQVQPGSSSLDGLTRVELDEPAPGREDIVVRVRAAALNARDQGVVAGRYRGGPITRATVPLSDGAGEVVAVGEAVTRVAVGERVAGVFVQGWIDGAYRPALWGRVLGVPLDGMLRERAVLHQDGVVRIPDHLSFEEAATLPCAGVTAWHGLTRGRLKSGETVLLIGTGGVSIFGLQLAKAAGARAVVTSSSDAKLERARALGADATVNYCTHPEWEQEVLRLTDGRGVDHVLEVGGATLPRSLAALAPGGRIHVIGFVSGRDATISLPAVTAKDATIDGLLVGSRAMFEAMNAAISATALRPVVDRVFGFEEARAAYEYQASPALFGKVVIRI